MTADDPGDPSAPDDRQDDNADHSADANDAAPRDDGPDNGADAGDPSVPDEKPERADEKSEHGDEKSERADDAESADQYEAAREFLQYHIDDHGFLSWIGTTVDEVADRRLVMTVPYDDKLTNSGPGAGEGDNGRYTVNGGIAATLIDTCGGIAVRASLEDPVQSGVATIDLNVSYLRPARGDLTATAEVVRIGGTVGVSEVSVVSETGDGVKEVAVGRGSYRIFNS